MQTKIQKRIVSQYEKSDPQLASKLNELEKEAQKIFISHYGVQIPDTRPTKATLHEFLVYVTKLGGNRKPRYEDIGESNKSKHGSSRPAR